MRLKDYNIVFSGLSLGSHEFEFVIDDAFFKLFDYTEMEGVRAVVRLGMIKMNNMLELHFEVEGTLPVTCDLTEKPFEVELENEADVVIKFGEAYDDTDDEILVLPHGSYEFNIAQYIYELLVLAVPSKKVHPDVLAGDADEDVIEMLKQYLPDSFDDEEDDEEEFEDESDDDDSDDDQDIDPRWNKLKDLLK